MKRRAFLSLSIFCSLSGAIFSQTSCPITNNAFSSGEELRYQVIYNWGLIWLESAQAIFKVKSSELNGKKCYLLSGSGSTYPKYDWFFQVKDLFETYLDSATFRPLKFTADIHEGSKKDKHTYIFNPAKKKAYTIIKKGKANAVVDTLNLAACTIDVLTAIYFARNIDYSKCRTNDTVSISLLLDGKVYAIYVRYLGKERYTSKDLGTYDCIKFSPLLVQGSIFKKGEGMTVWVSNDKNKIPLYIETPITVGTVKVKLVGFKGLKNQEEARITR